MPHLMIPTHQIDIKYSPMGEIPKRLFAAVIHRNLLHLCVKGRSSDSGIVTLTHLPGFPVIS